MPAEHGLARLLQEVRPHAASMCAGVLCLAVATLGELAIMRACGTAVDLLTRAAPASEGAIDAAVGWLMLMFGVVAVFKHLGEYALRAAGESVVARVSKEILGELLREEVAAHDATTVGALTSVLSIGRLAYWPPSSPPRSSPHRTPGQEGAQRGRSGGSVTVVAYGTNY